MGVNGNLVIVGSFADDDNGPLSGSAYIFRYDGASWVEEAKLLPSDGEALDNFAFSVAIDGNVAVVGAQSEGEIGINAGATYVFRYDPGLSEWIEEAKLFASDGRSLASSTQLAPSYLNM